MAVSVAERKQQQAAQCEETAGRFPGWHIWTTREGSPVATRTGNRGVRGCRLRSPHHEANAELAVIREELTEAR